MILGVKRTVHGQLAAVPGADLHGNHMLPVFLSSSYLATLLALITSSRCLITTSESPSSCSSGITVHKTRSRACSHTSTPTQSQSDSGCVDVGKLEQRLWRVATPSWGLARPPHSSTSDCHQINDDFKIPGVILLKQSAP